MIEIVDNFFENPNDIREIGLNLIQSKTNYIINDEGISYPGVRVDCPPILTYFIKSKIENLFNKKIKNIISMFHLTSNVHECGLIHHDSEEYAALIYLNPNPFKNCGTSFHHLIGNTPTAPPVKNFAKSNTTKNIEEIQSFVKYKKNYNKTYFSDPYKVVDNQFNRFIFYTGKQYHTPQNYFGDNLFNSRLIIIVACNSF